MKINFENSFNTAKDAKDNLKRFYLEIVSKRFMLQENKIVLKEGTDTVKILNDTIRKANKMLETKGNITDKQSVIILMRRILLVLTENEKNLNEKLRREFGDKFELIEDKLLKNGIITERDIDSDFLVDFSNDDFLKELVEEANLRGAILIKDREIEDRFEYGDFKKYKFQKAVFNLGKKYELSACDLYTAYQLNKVNTSELKMKSIIRYEIRSRDNVYNSNPIIFYADKNINNFLLEHEDSMDVLLMAILKAKQEGREYIGKIDILTNKERIFIVKYDDNLENAVKRLVKFLDNCTYKENFKESKNYKGDEK